jgi:hypothetical protein
MIRQVCLSSQTKWQWYVLSGKGIWDQQEPALSGKTSQLSTKLKYLAKMLDKR